MLRAVDHGRLRIRALTKRQQASKTQRSAPQSVWVPILRAPISRQVRRDRFKDAKKHGKALGYGWAKRYRLPDSEAGRRTRLDQLMGSRRPDLGARHLFDLATYKKYKNVKNIFSVRSARKKHRSPFENKSQRKYDQHLRLPEMDASLKH